MSEYDYDREIGCDPSGRKAGSSRDAMSVGSSQKKKAPRRGSGSKSSASSDDGGYSSDGVMSRKKKEARNKLRDGTSKWKHSGSESDLRSCDVAPIKPRSASRNSSFDSSAHSVKSADAYSSRPSKSLPLGSSSEHGAKASKSAAKKKSGLDGSDHSCRSTRSASSRRKPSSSSSSSKKSKDKSGLDGSDHSCSSTRSNRSSKASKSSKDKKLRGGKKSKSMTEASEHSTTSPKPPSKSVKSTTTTTTTTTTKDKGLSDDAKNVISDWVKPVPSNDGENKPLKKSGKKGSSSDLLSAEIKNMLDDDDAFSGSIAPLKSEEKKNKPGQKKKDNFVPAKVMSTSSAMFHDLWQSSFSANLPQGGKGTSALQKKKEKENMEQQMAEMEELRKKMFDEHVALQQAHDELKSKTEMLTLRLKEAARENADLADRIVKYEEKESPDQAFDRAMVTALRRQVNELMEENEDLKANQGTGEETPKKVVSTSAAAKEEDETIMIKLAEKDAIIATQNKEMERLEAKLKSHMEGRISDSSKSEVESLKKSKEGLLAAFELERSTLNSKLKSKDETIRHLMEELGKLKVSRGVSQDTGYSGEMTLKDDDGASSLAARIGSVFTRSPGAMTQRRKVSTSDSSMAVPSF